MATEDDKKKRLGQKIGQQARTFREDVTRPGASLGKATFQVKEDISNRLGQFFNDIREGYSGPSPVQSNPNQRNQASSGITGGAQTTDASGTGARSASPTNVTPTETLGNINQIDPDQVVRTFDQANTNRGFNTQLTQLGATAGDGTQLPSRGGVSSVVSGRNPVEQLATFREQFGTVDTNTRSGSGVTFIPNSYARERNARISDPGTRLLNDLDRQVRLGRISARAAGNIAAKAIGDLRDERLGVIESNRRAAADSALNAFKDRQLRSNEAIAARKLEADSLQSRLDRASRETIAQSGAATDAAKLGLDIEKLAETQRSNLAGERNKQAELGQRQALRVAELLQEGQLANERISVDKQKLAGNIIKGITEGNDPYQSASLLSQLLGEDTAAAILKNSYPDFFSEE